MRGRRYASLLPRRTDAFPLFLRFSPAWFRNLSGGAFVVGGIQRFSSIELIKFVFSLLPLLPFGLHILCSVLLYISRWSSDGPSPSGGRLGVQGERVSLVLRSKSRSLTLPLRKLLEFPNQSHWAKCRSRLLPSVRSVNI